MPTSVVTATLLTTFARIAVPTLLCASGAPPGNRTFGVTERRLLGVKLTAAAANAGEVGCLPVPDTGICAKDRLNGALLLIASVSPRAGDASAGPASAESRTTAGISWSPRPDAIAIPPRSKAGICSMKLRTCGPLPSSIKEREGNARPRSVADRGLTVSRFSRDVAVPEPSGATVVEMTTSCAVATPGAIRAYKTAATTPIEKFRRRWRPQAGKRTTALIRQSS
jgi:hypothetical protein